MDEYKGDENSFCAATAFDFKEWHKEENYSKAYRDDEPDDQGNVVPIMKPNFNIIISVTSKDRETFDETMARIPHSD